MGEDGPKVIYRTRIRVRTAILGGVSGAAGGVRLHIGAVPT